MIFEVGGDEVMVYLKKCRFHGDTYSKLKMVKFGPYIIFSKFDSGNAYEVDIPNVVDISLIFNDVYLYKYHEFGDDLIVLSDYLKK